MVNEQDDQSWTPSYLERVVAVCDAFEAAWRDGRVPRIEDYLRGQVGSIRQELLRELLAVELELRARFGDALLLQDYLDRFPGDAELVNSAFASAWIPGGSTKSDVLTHFIPGAGSSDDGAPSEPDLEAEQWPVPQPGTELFEEPAATAAGRRQARIRRLGRARPTEPPAWSLPHPLGRFSLLALVGRGTYGAVYRARDDMLDREVAIKIPCVGVEAHPATIAASLAEAKNAARIRHPAIVAVYDVVQLDEGQVFVVMEYVEGSTLRDELKAGHVAPRRAAELIAQVAEALHYAHCLGFVHRDLKPANILIDRLGNPRVADFGLAVHGATRPGRSGELAGTAPYMAPEQIRGEAHRLDGRTDVWALGVILYELLTGRRPFSGTDRAHVFEEIVYSEVRPPRQLDGTMPRELERICLKCLSKRMNDRYPTAGDLAEDLRGFLAVRVSASDRPDQREGAVGLARVVPKGLRAFSPEDAPFFLELVPGPRDHDGLPEIVRFWKTRIEATDRETAFALGLIFGPSGCGKSSLVHAGILPRLADSVLVVSIAASGHATEQELLRRLRHHCPELCVAQPSGSSRAPTEGESPISQDQGDDPEIDLPEALRRLRHGSGLSAGKKILIVLDQFEQFLQSCRTLEASPLVEALRQCDGVHVQCLVLVRDDFWMALSRFLRILEIDLSSDRNMTAVDLFDRRHARAVLAAFGRGYGALPEDPQAIAPDQEQFLSQAIDGLVKDERIVCVRLALFAEMVKDRPWTPAVLDELGGIRGVGAAFLDATIGARARHPLLRSHGEAARAILQALLPAAGSLLRGRMRSRAELLVAAGYDQRQGEFEELLRVLDSELRLITPTEERLKDEGGRMKGEEQASESDGTNSSLILHPSCFYQLTHDYLVHSLRDWLERTERATRRGRALLRLGFLTGLWTERPEPRNLPSFPEWLTIRWHTRLRDWSPAARAMMGAASRRLTVRLVAAIVVPAVLGLWTWGLLEQQRGEALFNQLMIARAGEIPNRLREFRPYVGRFRAQLGQLARDSQHLEKQVLARLALLPEDRDQVAFLVDRLQAPDMDPEELGIIRDELARHQRFASAEACWRAVSSPATDRDRRLHIACALAALDPKSQEWDGLARAVASALVEENPSLPWAALLRPVREKLTPPLRAIYEDESALLSERFSSGEVLADFSRSDITGDATLLTELVIGANPEQFRSVFTVLHRLFETHRQEVVSRLQNELGQRPAPRWADARLDDGEPPDPAVAAQLEVRDVGGCFRDRFAFCQALPLDKLLSTAGALASRGYRPSCVRPYESGGRLLVAAVWLRDGLKWQCELDLTAAEVQARDEGFRQEWLATGQGYLPVDIAVYRARGPRGAPVERYAALWVEARRQPDGSLARLEFIDAQMSVAVDAAQHNTGNAPLDAAGFVPRTNVAVTGADGITRLSSVRWKLRAPPRPVDTWDAGTWAEVKARVKRPPDLALMPVDVRFSWPRAGDARAYASTWWSGVGFESVDLVDLGPADHRRRCEALAGEDFRPLSIAAVEIPGQSDEAGPNRADSRRVVMASVWCRPLVAEPEKDRLARRQANAAIALFLLGEANPLWQHPDHSVDPRLHGELIERLADFEVDPRRLFGHLRSFPRPGPPVRRALLLTLAAIPAAKVPSELKDALAAELAAIYRGDPDRGIHSAAESVLRHWGFDEAIQGVRDQLRLRPHAPDRASAGHQWFVTPGGDTMVILSGPIEFTMGSPGDEPLRDHGQELLQRRRIERTIAVATKEVTRAQFLRFFPEHPHKTAFGLAPECPVNWVSWYDAVRYCNRLSIEEGLQPCYPGDIGPGMVIPAGALERPGYRLPTEAEWEAFCRAGTTTTWSFGHSQALVSRYAWTVLSAGTQSHPVGRLLPNEFGLFDTAGNVFEWCHDRFELDRAGLSDCDSLRACKPEIVEDGQDRVMRGGSFLHPPHQARSACRARNRVNEPQVDLGFRVVRTLPGPRGA
jgi:formylglycine-generating enzyme required for sulfatase activity